MAVFQTMAPLDHLIVNILICQNKCLSQNYQQNYMHQSLRLIFKTEEDNTKRKSFTSQTGRTTAQSNERPQMVFKTFGKLSANDESIKKQIKDKCRTFARFNPRQYLLNRKNMNKKKQEENISQSPNFIKYLMNFANQMQKKEEREKKMMIDEEETNILDNVVSGRRERFKKSKNPLEFIRYYSKKNKIPDTTGKKELVNKIVQLKAMIQAMPSFQLERTLDEIYELMALTVDYNDLKLLVFVVLMTAQICSEAKDFKRGFFFFNQAKIAAEYAKMPQVKIDAFVGMAKIALQMTIYDSCLVFLKKALSYAWYVKDVEKQLLIFDQIGHTYWQMGNMDQANYYHMRYSQSQSEKDSSAIKTIYLQIIKDSQKGKMLDIFGDNLDMLFISTLSLPIANFDKVSPPKSKEIYNNYVGGESPRKKISYYQFTQKNVKNVEEQIDLILKSDPEFVKDMPDPNVQQYFVPSRRYGREKNEVDFSRTVQFHRITKGKTMRNSPFNQNISHSTQKRIKMQMQEKMDPEWYQKMVKKVKMERTQKLGTLKDQIQKSHLKVRERKRSLSNQCDQIKYTVNKAVLNWVDPQI